MWVGGDALAHIGELMKVCDPLCYVDTLLQAAVLYSPALAGEGVDQQWGMPGLERTSVDDILPNYLTVDQIIHHWGWFPAETFEKTTQGLLDEKFEQAKASGLWTRVKAEGFLCCSQPF